MSASRAYRVFIHAMAVLVGVIFLAPLAWLVYASLVPQVELLARPYHWWPRHWTTQRYADIFAAGGDVAGTFRYALVNSFIVAAITVIIALCVAILGGYAYARLRFPLRRATLTLFLTTYMLPPITLVIPLYLALSQIGLLDQKTGLVIMYCSLATPFALWTMSNFLSSLPADLEDAARVDGCSRLGALVRVILPLARPGIVSTGLFAFLLCWDEFMYALVFTSSTNAKTIPVAIAEFTGRNAVDFGLIAAGGVLATIPPVVIGVVFQRYLLGGLASGAVKG